MIEPGSTVKMTGWAYSAPKLKPMDVLGRLSHARTTSLNDDLSEPGSEKRRRHIDRFEAMTLAGDEIERLLSIINRAGALAMQKASAEMIRDVLADAANPES